MVFNKPTLIIDRQKVEHNIATMLSKISDPNRFRPHFKTHYSRDIGSIFKKYGVNRITVSSVEMANYFAADWNDITIAFPFNLNEISDINKLSPSIKLNLLIESAFSADKLASELQNNVGIFIKIDTGYHRTGIQPHEYEKLIEIMSKIDLSPNMTFKGFLTHAGHTYAAKGKTEIMNILDNSLNIGTSLKTKYNKYPDIIFSYGDTPSCSMADNLDCFDELRPGNFIYYDIMQYHLGSCKLEDIAACVVCPVVATHPERNEIVIYGGAVHLSKEAIIANDDFRLFGYVVDIKNDNKQETNPVGWSLPIEGTYVKNISQEHGVIHAPDDMIKGIKPGDLVGILPVHSCLTANLLKENQIII